MSTSPPTILIIPFGHVLAHASRCLMIGRGLRELGDRVVFGGDGRYLELARQDGFEVKTSLEIDFGLFLTRARKLFAGVGSYTADLIDRMVQDELRLYREIKPDLVVYDFHPTAATSAQLAGIPHASVVNAYLTRYSATDWVSFPPLLRLVLEPLRRYLMIRPANRVRRRYGLQPIGIRDALTGSGLVLMPDIPEFAPTRNLPAHAHYIGPLVWEPDGELPEAVSQARQDHTVVYFTLGSTGFPHTLRAVINGLAGSQAKPRGRRACPEPVEGPPMGTSLYVIISSGDLATPADLGPLPDNFYVTRYLPGSQVVKQCDLVICHGGNSTVYQALTAGVPVIAIPTHRDQRLNAELLINAGAGAIVRPEEADKMGPVVQEVLSKPSYKENAARLQRVLSNYDGPRTAARLIHAYLAR
jgi:UDP:flavonoid glycosyltransferase YjiC (YdhE family)